MPLFKKIERALFKEHYYDKILKAIEHNDLDFLKKHLASGGNLNAYLLVIPEFRKYLIVPLIVIAASSGTTEMLELLHSAGAKINELSFIMTPFKDYDTTPLIESIKANSIANVRFFIQHGADIELKDSNGWSPMTWAVKMGNKELIQLLMQYQHEAAKPRSQLDYTFFSEISENEGSSVTKPVAPKPF